MIIWITGLSGSGKSTTGEMVYRLLKERQPHTTLLDGDQMRKLLRLNQGENSHTKESREKIAWMYHALCQWLDSQGINVICCTISGFEEIRRANREVFLDYIEVYLKVPVEILAERDTKNLYKRALQGELKDVVGVDIPFPPPSKPDLVIDNSNFSKSPEEIAREILALRQFF
jgi:cytidine diphosphoramidate kinase